MALVRLTEQLRKPFSLQTRKKIAPRYLHSNREPSALRLQKCHVVREIFALAFSFSFSFFKKGGAKGDHSTPRVLFQIAL